LKTAPEFDPIRTDARFADLLRRASELITALGYEVEHGFDLLSRHVELLEVAIPVAIGRFPQRIQGPT
jgi:hypothetical protein